MQCYSFLHSGLEDRKAWLWGCGTTWGATAPEQQKKGLGITRKAHHLGTSVLVNLQCLYRCLGIEMELFSAARIYRERPDSS